MNHDAYRPKDSIEVRRQAVEAMQKAIDVKFTEALFGNLIEDDISANNDNKHAYSAVVLIQSMAGEVFKLRMTGSDKDDTKEYALENFSTVGATTNMLTAGKATLRPLHNPGVVIEDHLSERPRLIQDAETIQYFTEIIDTSQLLTAEEKAAHRTLVQKDLTKMLGLNESDKFKE